MGYNCGIMKKYWPLLFIALVIAAVVGVSHYAEKSHEHCEESAKQAKAAAVAKGDDGKSSDNTEDACKPPVWARYFTWPESVGALAVILTLFVIAWQSIETAKAANATQESAILIKRQADLMEGQAKDARDSSANASQVAQGTLDELRRQAAAMESQAQQMVNQTLSIQSSVAAAQQSADAANAQIVIMKNRERARLAVRRCDRPEISAPSALLDGGRWVVIHISLANDGPTKAFNVEAYGELLIAHDLKGMPHEAGFRQEVRRTIGDTDKPIMRPKVCMTAMGVFAKEEGLTAADGVAIDETTFQQLHNEERFLQINGLIRYQDIFGDTHETPIRYLWRPLGNDMGEAWRDESYWMDLSPPST